MKDRMLAGGLYLPADPELSRERVRAQELLASYNRTRPAEQDEREHLLRALLGGVGQGVVVNPPFRCDYGSQISIAEGSFVNYDCVMLDAAPIKIGRACQIAARVQLVTAAHPIDPDARRLGWESGAPISIGDDVWLGSGTIVCPGVEVGDATVVGAGSVITRDLPGGVVAVGSPARVVRRIDARDRVETPDPPASDGVEAVGEPPDGGTPERPRS